jgi:hypothetical protein
MDMRRIYVLFSDDFPITRRMVQHLSHLSIKWNRTVVTIQGLTQLFDTEVLSSLSRFALSGEVASTNDLRQVLSVLSAQCSISFDIRIYEGIRLVRSDVSQVLLETFRQLKSRTPIELTLELWSDSYMIQAVTLPHKRLLLRDKRSVDSKRIVA